MGIYNNTKSKRIFICCLVKLRMDLLVITLELAYSDTFIDASIVIGRISSPRMEQHKILQHIFFILTG